ncbi:uncharacterized protein [Malus domestica]|uniref:uncharacterized protein n=1 Tax=Malus domestica TaxID=3750 RepID=UPI00397523F3
MREFCKGEIIHPATTQFATNYIALDSLLKKKVGLKQLFTSDDWANHNFNRSNAGRMVESIVLNHAFWTQSEHVCQVVEPLYKVLRIVDTEVYPTMGAIYELILVVNEDLEIRHGARPGVRDDGTLILAVHNVYSKLDPTSPAIGQFGNEMQEELLDNQHQLLLEQKSDWWIMYGTDAPTVGKLAIKVLSQTASSSACETNWKGNQLYQWIRPLHLDDDDEDNPVLRVAEEARNEGINVEKVLEDEVGSSNADSLEELLFPRPKNTGIPPSSNPT